MKRANCSVAFTILLPPKKFEPEFSLFESPTNTSLVLRGCLVLESPNFSFKFEAFLPPFYSFITSYAVKLTDLSPLRIPLFKLGLPILWPQEQVGNNPTNYEDLSINETRNIFTPKIHGTPDCQGRNMRQSCNIADSRIQSVDAAFAYLLLVLY
jgi:hypothetical protein